MKEKCKKAVTDTISVVTFDPTERPGVANLISIHSSLTGKMTIFIPPIFFFTTYSHAITKLYSTCLAHNHLLLILREILK